MNATDPMGTQSVLDRILDHFRPLPPAPAPLNIPPPSGPPILDTDMNDDQVGGSTTFYPGGDGKPIEIPTLTRPDSHRSKPGAGNPYCSIVVGSRQKGDTITYGMNGAPISIPGTPEVE